LKLSRITYEQGEDKSYVNSVCDCGCVDANRNLAEGSVVNAVCNSTAMPSVKMKMVTKMLNGS
jgi:hypothetical protein